MSRLTFRVDRPCLRILLVLAALCLAQSCALHSTGTPLTVGSTAPEFALSDTDGTVWRLSEMIADGPAVVVFYRGYW